MFDSACKNLLVRGVNWIGDSVMTLPALKALKSALPDTRISLLVKPWVAAVFENNPDIDEIISYESTHNGLRGKIKLASLLRRKHFCGSILLQNAFDAALIAFLAGIKKRVGYNRDGRGFLLTRAVPLPENEHHAHQIYYYLNLLEQSGMKAGYSVPYIHLTLNERMRARELLKSLRKPVLAINPGATYGSAKRWFPERFAEVATWFIGDIGGSVVLFGGNSEIDITDEIYKKVIPEVRTSGALLNMAGKTSLRDFIALISDCDVIVTNDSGPMHLAYAVRTPLVAIFGSTNPLTTGPPPEGFADESVVITPSVPCSPCFDRTCSRNDMLCMQAVTSDEVFYAIKKLLPESPAVFFDRDGTLCRDTGYINSWEDFRIFPEIEHLRLLREKGFKLIGVSNQSGIARGIVDEAFVKDTNRIFLAQYGFDDFYYCPHHPSDHCACRKPEPEMLFRARARHRIDLRRSFIVGDKEADMLLAKAAGALGILVQTGETKESPHADFIVKDLGEAVKVILEHRGISE